MVIERATEQNLKAIVTILADDELGSMWERYAPPLPYAYTGAFELINCDTNQYLMVTI